MNLKPRPRTDLAMGGTSLLGVRSWKASFDGLKNWEVGVVATVATAFWNGVRARFRCILYRCSYLRRVDVAERWSELVCDDASPALWSRIDRSHVRKRFVVYRCRVLLGQWVVVVVLLCWEVGSNVVSRRLSVWWMEGLCISLARRPLLWPRSLLLGVVMVWQLAGWSVAAAGVAVVGAGAAQMMLPCFFRWLVVVQATAGVFQARFATVECGHLWWRQPFLGWGCPRSAS